MQSPPHRDNRVLLAVSHGTSSPAGQTLISKLVASVRKARPDVSVISAYVDVQQPDVDTALLASSHRHVTVVPLLLSGGYHLHVDLAASAASAQGEVSVTRALGPDTRLASVLARRLIEAGFLAGDHVIMAAAGSSDPSAVQDCAEMGVLLGNILNTPVNVGFLSAVHPSLRQSIAQTRSRFPGARIAVSAYLLAPGYFASLLDEEQVEVLSATLLTADEPAAEELRDIIIENFEKSFNPRLAGPPAKVDQSRS